GSRHAAVAAPDPGHILQPDQLCRRADARTVVDLFVDDGARHLAAHHRPGPGGRHAVGIAALVLGDFRPGPYRALAVAAPPGLAWRPWLIPRSQFVIAIN